MTILDDNEIQSPITLFKEQTIFQKIVFGVELLLITIGLLGVFFKVKSWAYANEMLTIGFLGLGFLYLLIPFPLFRPQQVGGYILSYFGGLVLFMILTGELFVIQSWPYAQEMRMASWTFITPLIATLLILCVINFKDKTKLYLYLRIGLRLVLALLVFN
jgi:hypothetical protein